FTLLDLFSYNEKHNEANGENGRDGANDNNSWNCGWEGVTDDPDINQLRRRLIKNSAAILLMSRGVPLIHMGDEIGHTKEGNNNTYCQDNALNWFNWAQVAENNDIFQFFKHCIAFRKAHPILRKPDFPQHKDAAGSGFPEISWHGLDSWNPDWADYNRTMAFMLCGRHVTPTDDDIYVGMNMHWESHIFELPRLRDGAKWHVFANTSLPAPNDICPPGQEIILADQTSFLIGARSIFILVGRIPRENL
ncbi:MAG: glycogen debranching enzyme, partial [Anaerolineales bacterium]|nr:glycogen debranching enzyme [Anaerolineales bacterium]